MFIQRIPVHLASLTIKSFKLHMIVKIYKKILHKTVADPGFPVGGRAPIGGRGPPTWVLFGENVCENEIGSHRGWHAPGTSPPDPPMQKEKENKKKKVAFCTQIQIIYHIYPKFTRTYPTSTSFSLTDYHDQHALPFTLHV